jgi:hypothetical protein
VAEKNRRTSTSSETILNIWLRVGARSAKIFILVEADKGTDIHSFEMGFGDREKQKNI